MLISSVHATLRYWGRPAEKYRLECRLTADLARFDRLVVGCSKLARAQSPIVYLRIYGLTLAIRTEIALAYAR